MDKKTKKVVIIIAIVVALLVAAFVTYRVIKKSKEKKKLKEAQQLMQQQSGQQAPIGPPPTAPRNDEFPLEKGSKGENVLYLQRSLNRLRPYPSTPKIAEDGDFGQKTYEAVITWVGTAYYPVTVENATKIMKMANDKSTS